MPPRPSEVLEVVEAPTASLDRPKPSVASFLRKIADDLDASRAHTAGTDFKFERLRIMSNDGSYDLFIGRYDPERHHPHRRRK